MQEDKKGRNVHEGHRERMRERLKNSGVSSFADHELLEMLLYNLYPRKDTNETAHRLLDEFGGSLELLLNADPADLERRCGLKGNASVLFAIISELGKRSVYGKFKERMELDSSELAGTYAKHLLSHEKRECFYAICLDAKSRLISSVLVSMGTVNETHVYIRSIVEAAVKFNASSIIIAHNHPGGSLTPSSEDVATTANVVRAMSMLDIYVADHIIVCGNEYVSMKDMGIM